MSEYTIESFVEAASVPLDGAHASGTIEVAQRILAEHPEFATASIHTAAILGEAATVRRFLAQDLASAAAKDSPRGWDALTHLCFSRYLRLDPSRSTGFVEAARALLDAGASPNSGWYERNHQPHPMWESVLYGAAGIAHHEELTRLLVERGADPNDGEVVYHAPEGWDNAALKVLVRSGQLTADSLATMLLRKADWHDFEGVKWLLDHGADPNRRTSWGKTALHNAILSDNAIEIVEALLDHGADPNVVGTHPEVARSAAGRSAASLAARRGRRDVLERCARRGIRLDLQGVDELIAACARDDASSASALVHGEPRLLGELLSIGGPLLGAFAGNGNTEAVGRLLELGVDVNAPWPAGDGYFGTARDSTALHVAAWRARHGTVRFLIERGTAVNEPDGEGRTPLALAVRACVDSYWAHRRSPESVAALLRAGASIQGVPFPSGYDEVDELLRHYGAH